MAKLKIEIDARDARRVIALLERDLVDFEAQVRRAESTTGGFSRTMKGLAAAAVGFFAVGALVNYSKQLATIADDYVQMDAKIKLVTHSTEEFEKTFEDIYQQGIATGTQLKTNTQAFVRLGFALKDTSSTEIVSLLDTVNKSLVVSGANAQEAAGFMTQWGQAMGSGVVNGDELRTMVESNSYLMGLLADEIGTNIRGLRDMGAAGTLTKEVFTKALQAISKSVNKDFGGIPLTIGRAVNKLSETWKRLITDADQVGKGSKTIAGAISDLAETFEENREEISNIFVGLIENIPKAIEGMKEIGSYAASTYSLFSSANDVISTNVDIVKSLLTKWTELIGLDWDKLPFNKEDLNADNISKGINLYGDMLKVILDVIEGKRNLSLEVVDFTDLDTALDEFFKELDNPPKVDLDLDTSKAKSKLGSLNGDIISSSKEWMKENEKSYEKMIESMGKSIIKMNKDIADSTKDFADDLRSLQREGMTDEGAFDDLNKQMDEYKQKAAAAAKAGNWSEQADYLARIKDLISSMPDEITQTVSDADVARAKKIYEYQKQQVQSGSSSDDRNLKLAIRDYNKLLQAQKNGGKEILSAADANAAKAKELKAVNEDIIANKKEQVEAEGDTKKALEETLATYKEMAAGAIGSANVLATSTAGVGTAWVKVGEEWERTTKDIDGNLDDLITKTDELIKNLNEISGSSSSAADDYDGARAIGGPVEKGKTYLVGEQGQELFTPSSAGTITPNSKLNGSGTSDMVNLNISLDGGTSIATQAPQSSVNDLIRQVEEKKRYAA